MPVHIGRIIKDLRTTLGITQQELAVGIMTQAGLSRIENEKAVPYADVLYKFSQRLGVDITYFFSEKHRQDQDYVLNTFKTIRRFVREKNYLEVAEILELELDNPLFASPDSQQFLYWHQGMVAFFQDRATEAAIEHLERALRIKEQPFPTEMDIQIRNTLGNIYSDMGEHARAIRTFQHCLDDLHTLPEVRDWQIELRLHYNLALALSKSDRDQEAIPHCQQGIKRCKKLETFYLLGELYYQLGYSYAMTGKTERSRECLGRALQVFEITEKKEYVQHVQSKLADLART